MAHLFEINEKLHYGLILLDALARAYPTEENISLQSVSQKTGFISESYLEEVAAKLREGDLVTGARGRTGGYRLTKDPSEITMEQIVTAVDGPIALVECQTASAPPCPVGNHCASKQAWQKIQDTLVRALRGMTLTDLVQKNSTISHRPLYLDHAATTPLDPRVFEAMQPYFMEIYGNPSSFHTPGKRAKDAMDESRSKIANILACQPEEILFSSGGTESDNLAILGFARANQEHGKHIVTTTIEHHAVLEAVTYLERKEGFRVTRVPVDKDGVINSTDVLAAIQPDTILVSVMLANNEIGTIQPVSEIGNALRKQRGSGLYPVLHTDACQAAGALSLDVEKLHVDLLTLNGSKIYGPKGIGALYLKKGLKIRPLQFGGSQERGLRPGTENVAAIIGLGTALEIAQQEIRKENARLIPLRDKLLQGILEHIPKTRHNGHPTKRLPNNVNISFLDLEGEALLLYLDAQGIFASTGSACASASLDPSHVILALGVPFEVAHGSIRFTLGRSTTEMDIDRVLEILPPLVEKLRSLSPVRVNEKYFAL
ncbi:MAG TPA: aminotransferase class V-fold PLP-dependent enzyme [Patescibacteria group bacterium]|nr:aminotransferase class V-fold PLP-dependent enzyme [Patescibacteria group bacterium]